MECREAQPRTKIQLSWHAWLHPYEQVFGELQARGKYQRQNCPASGQAQQNERRTWQSSQSDGVQPETNPMLCMYFSAHAKPLARLVEFILAYNNPVNQQRGPHSGKRCSKIRESIVMNDTWSDGPDRLKYNTFSKVAVSEQRPSGGYQFPAMKEERRSCPFDN